MKTRLLRKLRREAMEHFQFRIILEPTFGVWVEVMSFGESVYSTCNGKKDAEMFCRKATNKYILDRIKELRLR